MFKSSFSKYISLFLAVLLVSFALLFSVILVQTQRFSEQSRKKQMENSAQSISQVLSSYLAMEDSDLNTLIRDRNEMVLQMLRTEAAAAGGSVFLVDRNGNILIASDADPFQLESIPQESMEDLFQQAGVTAYVEGDLGGFLQEEALNYIVLLKKDFVSLSQDVVRQQTVGAIVITSEISAISDMTTALLRPLLGAAVVVTLITVFGFYLFSRKFAVPLQKMSESAADFAKGDFSRRLPVKGHDEIAAVMQAFNDMAESLEKLEQNRVQFLANVSHDLRTPMTTISGFVQNMLEGTIPPEKQSHYLQIILDETHRLSRLVETLLNMSRMDAGERRFRFQPFDLAESARQTLLSFEKRINEKKIEVNFVCPYDRLFVLADEDAIHQVLYNLFDNALKFTPQEGIWQVRVFIERQKALFAIRNSGEGIPPEELPQIFDRFYKSDRSRGLDKGGMGLGLYIAKTIISAHNEEIWVTSEYGKFTEFVFTLPLSGGKIFPKA